MNLYKLLMGDPNAKEITKLKKIVAQIGALEPDMQAKSDTELRGQTALFRQRLEGGESLDALLPEAYATVREATVRVLDQRLFDMQMIGGIVLHQGRIAEMKTGEGKTHTALLPVYLNGLSGKGVHVVTVNEYLARHQSQWMGKVYRYLGLSVGLLTRELDSVQRQAAYNADVTYATNNELGFDYLRDNMVIYQKDMVQRPLQYAIVDEVDSILIDEARTPLIISGAGDKSTDMYTQADRFVARLKNERDYEMDEKQKTIHLNDEGVRRAEEAFNLENLSDPDNAELQHHINQALRAHALMKLDRDYVVQNGQVVIVDEFTGRLMVGRRYSEGLHQAIEAKEGVKVERESRTLATITFQNYFRMYKKLSGMTGTAKTEEPEFQSIYSLDVVEVPTSRPMIRQDLNDIVYRNQKGKFDAVVNEIIERHATGQPILVGTVSVEKSEMLSDMLKRKGVAHEVLNAKFHDKEAEIVAQAGHLGAVTIATNMAGRGTDILLGGNADYAAQRKMRQEGYTPEQIVAATSHQLTEDPEVLDLREQYGQLNKKYKAVCDEEHEKVAAVGGLLIIGTERHESRRIDNQLRGRAGRLGDPGVSRFFVALDDDLMRLFGSDRIQGLVARLGMDEDMPLEYGMLSKQIEGAQKKVEAQNFDTRKHVLQYDDVMNTQRELIYGQRRQVLEGADMGSWIREIILQYAEGLVGEHCPSEQPAYEWNREALEAELCEILPFAKGLLIDIADDDMLGMKPAHMTERINNVLQKAYDTREAAVKDAGFDMGEAERVILLNTVDMHWMDHIDAMDQMRQGIGLQAYGNRDPVIEYKFEGHNMFESMIRAIYHDTLRRLYNFSLERQVERRQVAQPTAASHGDEDGKKTPSKRTEEKVGRNAPCPCGSGKKYKQCHGKEA